MNCGGPEHLTMAASCTAPLILGSWFYPNEPWCSDGSDCRVSKSGPRFGSRCSSCHGRHPQESVVYSLELGSVPKISTPTQCFH